MTGRIPLTAGELGYLAVAVFFCLWVPPLGVLVAGFGAWDRHANDRTLAFALLVAFAVLGAARSILPLTGG